VGHGFGLAAELLLGAAGEPVPGRKPMNEPILLVEDDAGVRTTIVTFLELEGYPVEAVSNTHDALLRLANREYPLVISDIYVDGQTGLDILQAARKKDPDRPVILMSARGSMETVMAATRNGAFDYLAKPFELDTLLGTIRRALEPRDLDDGEIVPEELPETEMIGSTPRMVEIYKLVSQVAPTDATVVIEGETGTGKELVARMIHRFSDRASHPFVAVDCTSIPAALLESELFGAMKGAFTGADRDRVGVFEAANRGTVFLDEIGDIDPAFQAKMLRFLQEREIRPVGSPREKKVDVRVVVATNRDLQKMVEEGKFREDLWFRLNVVRLTMPPLRERRNDVPLLTHFFLSKYNARYERNVKLTESGLKALKDFTWPGNIRQLQHLIERLTILAPNSLDARIDAEAVQDAISAMDPGAAGGETLAETEADQIRRVLAATGGNKSRAAAILGIERKTLYRKLERMKM
jgi:DNA-binding NtrC family response regulator